MQKLEERVVELLRRHKLAGGRRRVIVGVSGGPDSVALALLLRELARGKHLNWELRVAHLDHGVRGEAAERDRAFVRETARRLGLPSTTASLPRRGPAERVPKRSRRRRPAEDDLRRARYGFLLRAARKYRAQMVAVGHTLDDQAETVLLRLLRGAGLPGLRAMEVARPLDADGRVLLIRPLLKTRRGELIRYLHKKRQPYRLDETNRRTEFTRNRVRRVLLPLLERQFQPRISERLVRLAETAREAFDLIDPAATRCYRRTVRRTAGALEISRRGLQAAAAALQSEVLRRALEEIRPSGPQPTSEEIERIRQLLVRRARGMRITLAGGATALGEGDRLLLCAPAPPARLPRQVTHRFGDTLRRVSIPELDLELGLSARSNSARLLRRLRKHRDRRLAGFENLTVFLDRGKIFGRLGVRTRRPGDHFVPFGARQSQRLKSFFVNAKIPRRLRDRIPLLMAGRRIAWVVGIRPDERFRVTGRTKAVLIVRARGSSRRLPAWLAYSRGPSRTSDGSTAPAG